MNQLLNSQNLLTFCLIIKNAKSYPKVNKYTELTGKFFCVVLYSVKLLSSNYSL